MSGPARDWVALESGELTAQIDPLGAQLSVLRDSGGRDLLWDGEPSIWKGRAPLLFPIVGALAGGTYRLDSDSYRLPRHGFARDLRFSLRRSSRTVAEFELAADRATLDAYPFRFALQVRFELLGPALGVTVRIFNLGDRAMPASFGFHPAFRWPLPYGVERSRHFVEFEREEPDPVRRLDGAGLLTPAAHPTPVRDRRLPLKDSLFLDDAVIFDAIRSRSLTYGADGAPRLRVNFPDTPYLGLWTKPGAPFVCVEPWHGLADPAGFHGDFRAKPGVFLVPPAADIRISLSIALLAA
jgi:galactose mutarotase-like enzyme